MVLNEKALALLSGELPYSSIEEESWQLIDSEQHIV